MGVATGSVKPISDADVRTEIGLKLSNSAQNVVSLFKDANLPFCNVCVLVVDFEYISIKFISRLVINSRVTVHRGQRLK